VQPVAIEVLEHVGFEVGATAHFDDFKQRGEAKMVIQGHFSHHELLKAIKQMLEPQIGADSLIKGVFKKDHDWGQVVDCQIIPSTGLDFYHPST
jgi:hypothetical protein